MPPRLVAVDDDVALARLAADEVARLVAERPSAAVVLPTGNTPRGLYRELAARAERGDVDGSRLRVFQLDEYLGIDEDDPRSFLRWLREAVLDPLGVPPGHVVRLPGPQADPEAACRGYDAAVAAAGGFDLVVLGLGLNGHLGFNEPPVGPDAPTRLVELTEASRRSNAAYWGGRHEVPARASTAGMRALLAARSKLLLVAGAAKAPILRRTLEEPLTPDVPASYLRGVEGVTVIADRAALGQGSPDGLTGR